MLLLLLYIRDKWSDDSGVAVRKDLPTAGRRSFLFDPKAANAVGGERGRPRRRFKFTPTRHIWQSVDHRKHDDGFISIRFCDSIPYILFDRTRVNNIVPPEIDPRRETRLIVHVGKIAYYWPRIGEKKSKAISYENSIVPKTKKSRPKTIHCSPSA